MSHQKPLSCLILTYVQSSYIDTVSLYSTVITVCKTILISSGTRKISGQCSLGHQVSTTNFVHVPKLLRLHRGIKQLP